MAADFRGIAWACRAMAADLPPAGDDATPGAVESADPRDRLLDDVIPATRAALGGCPVTTRLDGFAQAVRSAVSCSRGLTNPTRYAAAEARLAERATAGCSVQQPPTRRSGSRATRGPTAQAWCVPVA